MIFRWNCITMQHYYWQIIQNFQATISTKAHLFLFVCYWVGVSVDYYVRAVAFTVNITKQTYCLPMLNDDLNYQHVWGISLFSEVDYNIITWSPVFWNKAMSQIHKCTNCSTGTSFWTMIKWMLIFQWHLVRCVLWSSQCVGHSLKHQRFPYDIILLWMQIQG